MAAKSAEFCSDFAWNVNECPQWGRLRLVRYWHAVRSALTSPSGWKADGKNYGVLIALEALAPP